MGPSGADFQVGGRARVGSRPLWISPTNSPVRLGVSPAAASTLKGFSVSGLRLYFPELEPWVARSVSLPLCPSRFICPQMWDHKVHQPLPFGVRQLLLAGQLQPGPPSSGISHLAGSASAILSRVLSARLSISASPTGLDECFFFNSLVVRLPCSSIFCQFWWFLCLNCCCPSGCARRHRVSTSTSILAGSQYLPYS